MSCYDWNATEWYESPPAPPLTPGSTDVDREEGSHWVILGVVLCEVAVVMIALGSDLQKYALTVVPPEQRCGPCSSSTTLWIVGLIIYFSGNGVFVAALGLAPASLCAALIATVVVANALISRVLLKETLARCDYHGGALIMVGIAVTAGACITRASRVHHACITRAPHAHRMCTACSPHCARRSLCAVHVGHLHGERDRPAPRAPGGQRVLQP